MRDIAQASMAWATHVPLHYTGAGHSAGHAGHFKCPASLKFINYKHLGAGHWKKRDVPLIFFGDMKNIKQRDILAGHWGGGDVPLNVPLEVAKKTQKKCCCRKIYYVALRHFGSGWVGYLAPSG